MRKVFATLALLLSAFSLSAQQTQVTAQQFNTVPINQAPNVTNASAVSDFEVGSTVRYYWIITQLNGVTSTPVQTFDSKGPVTLSNSSGGRVTITWKSPAQGATFDVLESSTSTLPNLANCACAVLTGITGTSVVDTGTYSAYNTTYVLGNPFTMSQSVVGGIPQLNFAYNGINICSVIPPNLTSCSPTGATGLTSVGLFEPPSVFSIANSPVTTGNQPGPLTAAFVPQATNTVFAGPTANSPQGQVDSQGFGNSSNANSLTFSTTPVSPNDFAFFLTGVGPISQCQNTITASGTGTWNVFYASGVNALFTQQLGAGTAPVTSTSNCNALGAGNFVGLTVFLNGSGTQTITQSQNTSGAFGGASNTVAFPGSVTAGHTLLAFAAGTPSGATLCTVTDTKGNQWTQVATITNGFNQQYLAVFASANIAASGADTVNFAFTASGAGLSGARLAIVEMGNLGFVSGAPSFQPVSNVLASAGISATGTQVFSSTTLANSPGGDVAVSATTATNVMTRTVTMPASGCPCRAFVGYTLYVTTAASGVGYSAWVSDGTVTYAGSNQGQSNGSSGALVQLSPGAPWSTATYANGANVTFTLVTEGDHAYTVKGSSQLAGSAPNSTFQVAIQTSN